MTVEYDKTCFVIMPFGRKPVGRKSGFLRFGSRKCDFNAVYDDLFLPAVKSARLPEGGFLECRRADKDFFAGLISEEMFNYLEYSRIVLADISSVNANVFYELGIRHRARSAGTVVFRQTDAAIPFNINQVRTFPYEVRPARRLESSKTLVTSVLERSLLELRLDSSVQLAIRNQRGKDVTHPELGEMLRSAEDSIRAGDNTAALANFEAAVSTFDAGPLIRLKLGLLYRDRGDWSRALSHFEEVIKALPTLADGYREKGIAEQKRYSERQTQLQREESPQTKNETRAE